MNCFNSSRKVVGTLLMAALPLVSTSSHGAAIYASDVSAELTYSVTSGDIADLSIFGETSLFSSAAMVTGPATTIANASGSGDAFSFTSPLLANVDGATYDPISTSEAEWSADAFLDFENIGSGSIEVSFNLDWSYSESTSIDDAAFDSASASSFILLLEILDNGDLFDLFEVDTLADFGLSDVDSGSLSFSRTINAGEFYSLELAITAEGEAMTLENTTPPTAVGEPATLILCALGLVAFIRRKEL